MISILASLNHLYQEDRRYGDDLIKPLRRFVSLTLNEIDDLKTHPNRAILVQAERIARIALLALSALIATIPAVCGMALKFFQKIPKKTTFWHLLDCGDEPSKASNQSSRVLVSGKPFPSNQLSAHILSVAGFFLSVKDKMSAKGVSKLFLKAMKSPWLWSSHLGCERLRIYGATSWKIKIENGQLNFFPEDRNYLTSPYDQLCAYIRTFHHYQCRTATHSSAFEYWARLMKGGPLAFANIPKVQLCLSFKELTPELLQRPLREIAKPLERDQYKGFNLVYPTSVERMEKAHSIIIGIDRDCVPFVVFNVKRVDEAGNETSALILLTYRVKIQTFGNELGDYYQQAHGFWRADQLQLSNEKDLNYLLALLDRKPARQDLIDAYRLSGVSLNLTQEE